MGNVDERTTALISSDLPPASSSNREGGPLNDEARAHRPPAVVRQLLRLAFIVAMRLKSLNSREPIATER